MADAAQGSGFAYWSGDLYGNNPTQTLVIDDDKDISAGFYNALYRDDSTLVLGNVKGKGTVWWSVNGSEFSQLTAEGVTFIPGDIVTVHAISEKWYYFHEWTIEITNKRTPVDVTMTGAKAVDVNFRLFFLEPGFLAFLLSVLVLVIVAAYASSALKKKGRKG